MSIQFNHNRLLCREISLIEFNKRVLAQAKDNRVPLLERLKFLGIVSSNLDEFFEVRVAALKRLNRLNPDVPLINGLTPGVVLKNVRQKVKELINEQYQLLNEHILPALARENIVFLKRNEINETQSLWLKDYFNQQIKPIITPISLDSAHPFPKLLNKSLNFIIALEGEDAFGLPANMAVVQAPRILPRMVKLPADIADGKKDAFVLLSSIIHSYVQELFFGMRIKGFYQFRLTRESELIVNDDDLKDLLAAVQGELHDRQYGNPVRLEVATNCPEDFVQYLAILHQLREDEIYRVNGPVNLYRFMTIPDCVERPDLKFAPKTPSTSELLKNEDSIFHTINQQDVLLHHPYQSFQPVVNFIEEAAKDPQVVAIKMTVYRTGHDSDIIKALISAALLGKEVTVVVELMARFDEEINVLWANKLEDAGAHVVYGIVSYKVHAKMILVLRKEGSQLKRYGHLGTGNYHQRTSKLYTDYGLLTSDPEITCDISRIFMEITGRGQIGQLYKIYHSPFTLHHMLINAIDREIKQAKQGKGARLMAKMNSLVEPQLINALYQASAAGVEIDLIVRGICVLNPGVPGLSDRIRVRSIIGRLLEHSRVFYFYNNGKEDLYISSADWMIRNMFNRVETCVPIENKSLKRRIVEESFTLALDDNQLAWDMQPDGIYKRAPYDAKTQTPCNLQESLFEKF